MATFHGAPDGSVRCYAKGAPDVLLARSTSFLDADGNVRPIDGVRDRAEAENARLAGEGLRALAVARRDVDHATIGGSDELLDVVDDLQLLALIGIVDPPRKEARCHRPVQGRRHPRADDHR